MITNTKLSLLRRLLQNSRQFHSSRIKKTYEGSGKTTIGILNNEMEDINFIKKCIEIGFQLNNGTLLVGPIVIFPKTLLSWNVGTARDINEKTLSLFTTIEPPLDIIVIGLETNYSYEFQTKIRGYLKEYNIRAEILPSVQACGSYNFLVSEGRHVGAGLIPPLLQKSPIPGNLSRKLEIKQPIG